MIETDSITRLITISLVAALAGCGGANLSTIDPGGGASSRTVVTVRATRIDNSAASSAVAEVPASMSPSVPGTLKGQILIDGPAPKLTALVKAGLSKVDPTVCAHSNDIPDESMLVSGGGGLKNVFVFLDKAPDWYKDKPTVEPSLDQKACLFHPHALIVPVGATFLLKNSDTVAHNVKTEPGVNTGQNDGMPPGSSMTMLFKRAEKKPFQSKCAIHPWMEFYTLTLNHPFSAISDSDGRFEIKDLRAGKYKFRVWHERNRELDAVAVEIKGGETKALSLKYKGDSFGSKW